MAQSLAGKGVLNAHASIAASTTDGALVSAVPACKIRVLSFLINQGDTTPSTVTFNSKGSGAGTSVFPALKAAANGGFVADTPRGWFETNVGEGLTVTTGAGSTTGIIVQYQLVRASG